MLEKRHPCKKKDVVHVKSKMGEDPEELGGDGGGRGDWDGEYM